MKGMKSMVPIDSAVSGMRYARLGRSDLRVSVLSYGCDGSAAALSGHGDGERTAYAMLDRAFAAGITSFDTANADGDGRPERRLGEWVRSRGLRDQVVLTTKVGNRAGPGDRDAGLSPRHVRAQVEASLRRLGTDYIDLYLTHTTDPGTPIEETLTVFDDLIRQGKLRHYGLSAVSGQDLADAVAAATVAGVERPANMRGGYNLIERHHEAGTLPSCRPYGVGFTAVRPLAGGVLAGGDRPGAAPPVLPPGPHSQLDDAGTARVLDRLRSAAARRDMAPATLALAWVLGASQVGGAVIAPRTPDQLSSMVAALEVPLTAPERVWLASGDGEPMR